jgi:hypothetical protein
MPLVNAVEPEKVGGRTGCGGGLFMVPRHHGDVIPKDTDGVAPAVYILCEDILMGKQSGELQIRVGDGSIGVLGGDQLVLDMEGEWSAPQKGRDVAVCNSGKPHTSHPPSRGIVGAYSHGIVRNNLGQIGGTGSQRQGKMLKIRQLVAHGGGNANAVAVHMSEPLLEEGKQAPTTRDAKGHAAEFPKGGMPSF